MISPKQNDFLKDQLPRLTIVEGCISSGKTFICNHKAIYHILQNYKQNGLIFFIGRTLTTLERNVLQPLALQYGKLFTYSINKKRAKLGDIEIQLEGCNDISSESKIRGSTAFFVYGDEITLWNKPFLMRCMGSLRVEGACFLGTTNPDHPDNFVYSDYIMRQEELKLRRIKFDMDDNPSLTETYKEEVFREYVGVWHDRMIKGLWVRAEGVIYRKFADNPEHYIKSPPPNIKLLVFGTDWGHNKSANTCMAVGVTDNYQHVHVLGEFYTKDELSPDQLYTRLVKFQAVHAEHIKGLNYCDSAEPMLVRGLRNANKASRTPVEVKLCVKHTIMSRIDIINMLISQNRFSVSPECTHLISALKNAVWNEKSIAKDERLDDGTTDIDSLDALEYSLCAIMDKLDLATYKGGVKYA